MLKKHGQLFLSLAIIFDSTGIIFSWLAAYYVHFKTSFGPPLRYGTADLEIYLNSSIPVLIIFLLNTWVFGLYKPLRGKPITSEVSNLIKVISLSILLLTALTFFYREHSFSRIVVIYF